MSEDERLEMLRTVAEAHSGLREVAFRLGREMRLKAPVLKEAINIERLRRGKLPGDTP